MATRAPRGVVLLLALLASVPAIGVAAVTWNTAAAISGSSSLQYPYCFTVCARYTFGSKGVASCAEHKQVKECRVDIQMKGPFWDFKNYKVVPCES